ncbi:MAG: rRNA pseudouridine synthase [Clostridia bacterium]|nr:rRNA pseudouridine synthase [Clostridia bacterium]
MKTRIDKILSESNIMTRSQAREAAKKGRIAVNGAVVRSSDEKAEEGDVISVDGRPIERRRFFYYMMNKPAGYVCATEDNGPTVLDLLSPGDKARGLFPVGRLDKDTVGLLIITNDGALAHELLSPKKHVSKTYFFRLEHELISRDADILCAGIPMDGGTTKPAVITFEGREGTIAVTEGKFHQIKRMFGHVGNRVTYLKRISFGPLELDSSLAEGEYRILSAEETEKLRIQPVSGGIMQYEQSKA